MQTGEGADIEILIEDEEAAAEKLLQQLQRQGRDTSSSAFQMPSTERPECRFRAHKALLLAAGEGLRVLVEQAEKADRTGSAVLEAQSAALSAALDSALAKEGRGQRELSGSDSATHPGGVGNSSSHFSKGSASRIPILHLSGISPAAFSAVLSYIYLGRLPDEKAITEAIKRAERGGGGGGEAGSDAGKELSLRISTASSASASASASSSSSLPLELYCAAQKLGLPALQRVAERLLPSSLSPANAVPALLKAIR